MTIRLTRPTTSLQAVAAALVLGTLTGCAALANLHAAPCMERIPAHASPAGVAYVTAIRTATPGWAAVSDQIRHQDGQMYPADYRSQVAVDEKFLEDLRAIKFPASAQADAARFEAALRAYIEFVQTSADQPGYLSAHRDVDAQVNDDRSAASAALRQTLHLPQARCVFHRP